MGENWRLCQEWSQFGVFSHPVSELIQGLCDFFWCPTWKILIKLISKLVWLYRNVIWFPNINTNSIKMTRWTWFISHINCIFLRTNRRLEWLIVIVQLRPVLIRHEDESLEDFEYFVRENKRYSVKLWSKVPEMSLEEKDEYQLQAEDLREIEEGDYVVKRKRW